MEVAKKSGFEQYTLIFKNGQMETEIRLREQGKKSLFQTEIWQELVEGQSCDHEFWRVGSSVNWV